MKLCRIHTLEDPLASTDVLPIYAARHVGHAIWLYKEYPGCSSYPTIRIQHFPPKMISQAGENVLVPHLAPIAPTHHLYGYRLSTCQLPFVILQLHLVPMLLGVGKVGAGGGYSHPVESISKWNGGEEGDGDEVDVAAHPGRLPQVGQHEGGVGHKGKASADRVLAEVANICTAEQMTANSLEGEDE